MKILLKAAFATAVILTSAPAVYAQSAQANASAADAMSSGEVKKVDKDAGKLIIYGPLKNLGMEAMTMVFRVKDPSMLDQVTIGDRINFVAESSNGKLAVTRLEKQP